MTSTPGTTTGKASTTYATTFSTTPNIGLGTNILQTASTSYSAIIFEVLISTATSSGFNVTFAFDASMNISSLSVSYLASDAAYTAINMRNNANIAALTQTNSNNTI